MKVPTSNLIDYTRLGHSYEILFHNSDLRLGQEFDCNLQVSVGRGVRFII